LQSFVNQSDTRVSPSIYAIRDASALTGFPGQLLVDLKREKILQQRKTLKIQDK
jgi:hypothetical protein